MTDLTRTIGRVVGCGVLLACLAVGTLGCYSTQGSQRPLDTSFIDPGKTTKEQVYQGLGMPNTLFFPGYPIKDRKWYFESAPGAGLNTIGKGREIAVALLYAPSRGTGAGIGLGNTAATVFYMGHFHAAGATLVVLIDHENRVMGTHVLAKGDYIKRRLWPFGA